MRPRIARAMGTPPALPSMGGQPTTTAQRSRPTAPLACMATPPPPRPPPRDSSSKGSRYALWLTLKPVEDLGTSGENISRRLGFDVEPMCWLLVRLYEESMHGEDDDFASL